MENIFKYFKSLESRRLNLLVILLPRLYIITKIFYGLTLILLLKIVNIQYTLAYLHLIECELSNDILLFFKSVSFRLII